MPTKHCLLHVSIQKPLLIYCPSPSFGHSQAPSCLFLSQVLPIRAQPLVRSKQVTETPATTSNISKFLEKLDNHARVAKKTSGASSWLNEAPTTAQTVSENLARYLHSNSIVLTRIQYQSVHDYVGLTPLLQAMTATSQRVLRLLC